MGTKSIYNITEAERTTKGRSLGAVIGSYFRLAIIKSLYTLNKDTFHLYENLLEELKKKINLDNADIDLINEKDYSEFEYRLRWNLNRIKKAGLIEKGDSIKSSWKISKNGVEFLTNFELIDKDDIDESKYKEALRTIRTLAKEKDGEETEDSENDVIMEESLALFDCDNYDESLITNIPRNKIYYGAPGTGKSFKLRDTVLNELKFKEENIKRITFHPSYSYQQFVGTYKPTPIYKTLINDPQRLYKSDKKSLLDGDEKLEPLIDYTFVAGPFLELLIEAIKAEKNNYMLIIEEINRANVASVFGDVFQLLDRKDNFTSEYEIDFNNDVRNYLISKGVLNSNGNEKIGLPKNLFIWGTMNNADQGVMPLDSAFKRRWAFKYIGINDAEKETGFTYSDRLIKFRDKCYNWNQFRKEINSKLKENNVNEDKFLGFFYMNESELKDSESIKNKLLLYLREDVLRHNSQVLFPEKSFSDIVEKYDDKKKANNDVILLNWDPQGILKELQCPPNNNNDSVDKFDSDGFLIDNMKENIIEGKGRPPKSVDEHLAGTSAEFRKVYNELENKIKLFGNDIELRTTFGEIIFQDKTTFAAIYVSKNKDRLRVLLRTINDQIDDPKMLTEIIPKTHGYGNITRRFNIYLSDLNTKYSLDDTLALIRQAYDSKK